MQPFKYNPNNNSGSRRHKITFFKPSVVKDELGQEEQQWTEVKSAWAMIKTVQGREYFAAASTQIENTIRFIIQYTGGIDASMRIRYKGLVYEIIAPPINDDELNKTLTIIAREV